MDENVKLIDLYNKSPLSKNLPIGNYVRGSGKNMEYNLFSWITGKDVDVWVSFAYMGIKLNNYGYSSQLYYDVVVLNIDDVSDRPKCRNCGKDVKFESLSRGYRDFCNLSCTAKWGNKVPSKIKNVSKALTGKKLSKEHRESLSRAAANRVIKTGGRGYYNTKHGKYKPTKSDKELIFDSSWEKEFMILTDKDKFIKNIDRPNFKIPYKSKGIIKNYVPDFIINTINNFRIVIEIKPKRLLYKNNNLEKRLAGKLYCRKNNMKYVILTEENLYSNISKNGGFSISDYII